MVCREKLQFCHKAVEIFISTALDSQYFKFYIRFIVKKTLT